MERISAALSKYTKNFWNFFEFRVLFLPACVKRDFCFASAVQVHLIHIHTHIGKYIHKHVCPFSGVDIKSSRIGAGLSFSRRQRYRQCFHWQVTYSYITHVHIWPRFFYIAKFALIRRIFLMFINAY